MTDREKVVRAVETCFDSWIDKHRNMGLDLHEVERMKRDALALLKEQEPVLVIQYWDDTYGDYVYACEWCGNHWISIDGSLVNYCPGCGKAVKWDDT